MSETPSKALNEPSAGKRPFSVTRIDHNQKENSVGNQKTRKRKRDRKPLQNVATPLTDRQTLITTYYAHKNNPNERTKCASTTPYRDRSNRCSVHGSQLFPRAPCENGGEPSLPISNQLSTESAKQILENEPSNKRKHYEYDIPIINDSEMAAVISHDNHARLPNEQESSENDFQEDCSTLLVHKSSCSPSGSEDIHINYSQGELHQSIIQGEQQSNLEADVDLHSDDGSPSNEQTTYRASVNTLDKSVHEMLVDEPPIKKSCLSDNNTNGIKKTVTLSEIGSQTHQCVDSNVSDQQESNTLNFADARENVPYEGWTQTVSGPPSNSVSGTSKVGNQRSGGEGSSQMILKSQNKGASQSIFSVERRDDNDVHSRESNIKLRSPKPKFGASGRKKVSSKRLKQPCKKVAKKSTTAYKHQKTLDVYLTTPSSIPTASPLTTNANVSASESTSRTLASTHTPSPTSLVPNDNIAGCSSTGGDNSNGAESRTSINSSEANTTKKKRRRRCGKCSSCSVPDCGECSHCVDKRGPKKKKQACQKKPMCVQWKEKEYAEAIRLGYVILEATKLTFSGVPGSGKTTLQSLLLNETLPPKRNSTPVATKATQATIVALDQEHWHKVDRKEIVEMIIDQLEDKRYAKEQATDDCVFNEAPTEINHEHNHQTQRKGVKSETRRSSLRQRLYTILNDYQQRRQKGTGRKLRLNKMIYLVDIGGQPELQEVVPLVVRNASVNLLVLKLSDELKAKPKNEWYYDGKCVTEPEEMDITNEEYLENAAKSVFLSKPKLSIKQAISVPDKPSVIIVGTHKDREHECPESLDRKEEVLKDKPIFNTHLKENHIKCVRGKVIVDIDGSESGYNSDENRAKLEKLRHALLTHSSKLKVKVPIAWFLLLLDIQMEADNSDFISLEKCYLLGAKLEISTDSVDAALQFFDELNLILYFQSSCPNVVFCNPEFLLQKLTDMILTGVSPDVDDQPGSRRIFREQGIFTRELFETPKFQQGFSPLFSFDDFLLLLQHLPIVAKISVDPEKEKYFMPCVLSFKRSFESISVPSPSWKYSVDPLVIIFPKECSPTGLFCATIVHLIRSYHDGSSEFEWVITASESLKRKRNVIEFQICDKKTCQPHYDNKLGTVILEDTSASFIVRTTVNPEHCHKLYSVVNSALETAIEELSYSADRIDYVFGIQCTMCTGDESHAAPVGTGRTWRCDRKFRNKTLTSRQRPWFEEQTQIQKGGNEDTDVRDSLSLGTQSIARMPKFPSVIWKLETLHNQGLTGRGTTIAIIDGGVASSHSSLQEKFNQPITMIDGYNFVSGLTTDWHGPSARDSHGTAVAAVAGGCAFTVGNNEVIPSGIAPNAELYICRIFHNNQLYNVHEAIKHILNLQKNKIKHIDVLCMSFKLPGKDEKIEFLLLQLANEGVVCVAAAGNDGLFQKGISFPASDPNVLSVGALKPLGQVSDLNPSDKIDVYASGENLVLPSLDSQVSVTMYDGTSFSTPMVAGFISLLIQCAKEFPQTTSNVVSKYHDIKFLKELFNNRLLCDKRKLLCVHDFLSDILSGMLNLISLIQEIYPTFSP